VALDGIDLDVRRGDSLAIVGRNGSGKTTLLRVLSGALAPTTGSVNVQGRVSTLIDLGAGVDPEFSGRENAILLAVLGGVSRSRAIGLLPEIRDFSGLGDAFEHPVRTYSAGMSLRLAFSAAVMTEPDVLLVDEVLAVGDAFFQQRCVRRIRELQGAGCTTILVTHDPSAAISFCDEAVWLDHGRVVAQGKPSEVMRDYLGAQYADGALLEALPARPGAEAREGTDLVTPAQTLPNIDKRYGDRRAEVVGVAVRDDAGQDVAMPRPGQSLRVVVTVGCRQALGRPIVGFTLRDRLGEILTATNSSHEGRGLPELAPGDVLSVEFGFEWPPFKSGIFSISPAVADGTPDAHEMNDWVDNALVLTAENPDAPYGRLSLARVSVRCSHRSEI